MDAGQRADALDKVCGHLARASVVAFEALDRLAGRLDEMSTVNGRLRSDNGDNRYRISKVEATADGSELKFYEHCTELQQLKERIEQLEALVLK